MEKLSIAMSGGGHRATLFGLGALHYFADSGKNRDTVSISSVSGGSIVNGYVGQQLSYLDCDGAAFDADVTTPLVRQISQKGTLFAPLATKLYAGLLAIVAIAAVVGPWFVTGIHWGWRNALHVVGLLLVLWIAGFRGRICRSAFRRTLFSPNGSPTPLSAIHEGVDHVMCATSLRSGHHVYFARDLAYGYQHGCGGPGDTELVTAVAASAAFPFGFPPLKVPTKSLKLANGTEGPVRYMYLADGGVYDNMGDQWAAGYERRVDSLPARYADRTPDQLVVVNSSAPTGWVKRSLLKVPIVWDFAAVKADQGIQYQNTTSNRRSSLIDRFNLAEQTGTGMTGVYVGIEQSPFRVASLNVGHPTRGDRAAAVLAALGDTPANRTEWDAVVKTNKDIKTQLSKMPADRCASIVHQAYVVSMCNAHVILGFPLLPIPDSSRFLPT